ncbi:hypothetical protein KXD40_008931 [Peronospora effusa]|uniref:Centromere protein J C-terminal domain-containing protein n=1 Tax=Peronospora effusa TaxID=542832 RepID=A0A3M6VIR5_9STRA|nr:hypothetical protein DD238_006089 [Peronospora effusa]RQM09648.1 hypothetical protein DD237_007095 [Peronospora effusa]UIZ21982.1 hypothetical protein KXD40_008931 [Peronospora effusa]
MTSGQQELRAWRKENDMVNRRHSITFRETIPVSGANIPFEELLARELRKSHENGSKGVGISDKKTSKKSYLKKGARGWWMQQRDAKKKLVKHKLTSNNENKIKTRSMMHRRPRDERYLSAPLSEHLSLSPEQGQTVGNDLQTLSPLMSPIQRTHYSFKDEVQQHMVSNDNLSVWKNASLRSTTSTDIMGIQNVRKSYEANQEREANDMAVFEAIERDLAVEKQAFLMEKQQQQQNKPTEQREQICRDNQSGANHCDLPYSSFVSDLNEQEELRRQTGRRNLSFDGSRDGEIDSALVCDDYSALSKDDEVYEQDGSTCQLREHFGHVNCCGDSRSDLSSSFLDDSVAWNDGLSLQSRKSVAHTQSSNIAAAGLNVSPDKDDCLTGEGVRQQTSKRELYFAECNGDGANALEHNKPGTPEFKPEGNTSVSFLVRHVFGKYEQDDYSNSGSLYYEDDIHSVSDDSTSINTACRDLSVPPPPPVQDRSLSNCTQKVRIQQQPPVTRTSTSKAKADDKQTKQVKVKIAASSRVPGTKSSNDTLTPSRDQLAQPANAGMILPAVIEEKLYELDAEVMFYKSETLQFQKRKDYYDQEVKKLALERDEFVRFQQEQRLQIEKEWERERTKMKKEAKLQERQWKLRMNASISHQDRKDGGETEMLTAQIMKMQVDEKARASKWKAENDNVRQRVLELEEKNRDLADKIKFLEKERLEQWEQYARHLKKTQEALGLASQSGVTSIVPSVLSEKNELRILDAVFAIKETADELLQKWNYPRKRLPDTHAKNDATARPASQDHVLSNAADSYNPKRYNYGRDSLHPLSESGTLTGKNELDRPSVKDMDIGSDTEYVRASNAAATYERALPAIEDVESPTSIGYRKSNTCKEDGTISASTSSLSESKVVTREIEHTGEKKEILYIDGSRKIIFPDGNEKDVDGNGHTVVKFTNGDHKEFFPDTGITVYYYYEAQTKLTTYPDNRKVYKFSNQQIETSLPDGTIEIEFPDGIKKTIRPNGDEFSVFPDGTTILEQSSGLREVTLLNQKKIRYFPDGQMSCVSLSGQETRIRSDSELKKLHFDYVE